MHYYYLDGLEKKGPYTAEEIANRNLKSDTLLFVEGGTDWKPLNDFIEFNERKNSNITQGILLETPQESLNDANTSNSQREHHKRKLKLPALIIFIAISALGILISYFIVSSQRENDLHKVQSQIDKILKGKFSVSDYMRNNNTGTLYDVQWSSFFQSDQQDILSENKKTIITRPVKKTILGEVSDKDYSTQLKLWNLFKDITQYYESGDYGGFSALHLTKDGSNYYIQEQYSGDMAYKVPESRYYLGTDYGYGVATPGYSIPTNRPSIGTCYEEAAKYLTVNNEDKSYDAGVYLKIQNFPGLSSEFYKIRQYGSKYYRVGNDVMVESFDGSKGKTIHQSQLTAATSVTDANLSTEQWVVWYRKITNYYRVEEEESVFQNRLMTYSFVAVGISLVIMLLVKMRKKFSFEL